VSGTGTSPSGPAVANFVVVSKDDVNNDCVLQFLGYNGDATAGDILAGAGISPGGVQSVIPADDYFVSRFISDNNTIAFGAIVNTPHGLNGTPEILQIMVVAQTTNDGGGNYTAADELDAHAVMLYTFPGTNFDFVYCPFSCGCNSSNVWIGMNYSAGGDPGPGLSGFVAPIKLGTDRFTPTLLDASKWKIKIVAVKLNAP
jgi:hypothetical protein